MKHEREMDNHEAAAQLKITNVVLFHPSLEQVLMLIPRLPTHPLQHLASNHYLIVAFIIFFFNSLFLLFSL